MVYKFNPFTNNLDLVGTGSGGEGIATLTGNSGGAVGPDGSGNVNVVGDGSTISFSGNPGTNTLTASVTQAGIVYYSLTPYIVGSDVHSQYSTIGAAITAFNLAGVPGNIYVKPGTYTENITLPVNCKLIAFDDGRVETTIIIGKITANYSGVSSISGFTLQTNSDFSVVVSGSNVTNLNIENCYIYCSNNTGISITNSNSSSFIYISNCTADFITLGTTLFVSSGSAILYMTSGLINNSISTVTPSSTSASNIFLIGVISNIPFSTSGTGSYSIFNSSINSSSTNTTSLSLTGTGTTNLFFSQLISGNSTALTIGAGSTASLSDSIINTTSANAISGAGTLFYTSINFAGTSSISVTTLSRGASVLANTQLTGYQVINAIATNHAASPYTAIATDYYIGVDTSGGTVTIRLPNAPITNRTFVIKDSTGHAAASNISVTTPGGSVTFDGQTTYTMNANYQAINVRFNGTNYEVF